MIKNKISYERRVYESVDDNSLSKAISQKSDEKNKSCNKGLTDIFELTEYIDILRVYIYICWCTRGAACCHSMFD